MSPEAAAIEALLFVTDEPVGSLALAETLELDLSTVEAALQELRDELEQIDSGIILEEIAGGWRLFTHPLYHSIVEKFVTSWDTRRLTDPSLEVLACVAYQQPLTRAQISEIRGVNSDSSLRSLIDKGLVEMAGTLDAPGNPATYRTTRLFLEHFGLRSISDLPPLESFAPDEATRHRIAERLAARGYQDALWDDRSGDDGSGDDQQSDESPDSWNFSNVSFDFDDE